MFYIKIILYQFLFFHFPAAAAAAANLLADGGK
jgi:hypothetical protein